MKYVLAKDIFPLGRKGEKVTILQNLSPYVELKIEKNPKWGIRIWSNDIQHLIQQGLIEEAEVKPREFYISYNPIVQELQGYASHDKAKIIKFAKPNDEIIKVREVLE